MSHTQLRILSASVLTLLLVSVLFLGGALFYLVFFILFLIAIYETYHLIHQNKMWKKPPTTSNLIINLVLGSLILIALLYIKDWISPFIDLIFFGSFLLWIIIGLYIFNRVHFSRQYELQAYGTIFLIIVAFLAMFQMQKQLIVFLLFIASVDTGAYFIGRKFGKNTLTSVSPNKTWEGFFGGLLGGVLTLYVLHLLHLIPSHNILKLLFLGVLMASIAVLGDLYESFLKRQAKVKDSGNLIPGHGGLLDRLDSIIAVAPFFLLFILNT